MNRKFNILLSNDDGVGAPGLKMLYDSLKALSIIENLTVVAPDRDRSAASKSLTINYPIRPVFLNNGFIAVDGTPTDCVHFALTAYLKQPPDMVISGINDGSNLGDDVMYSGTVAAATEGRFLGFPSIAISLASHAASKDFTAAGMVAREIVMMLHAETLPTDTILNINVPGVSYDKIQGMKVTRLGQRHFAEPMVAQQDPRGKTVYWIGQSGPEQDAGVGTDFYAVRENYVSITPLEIDLTKYGMINVIENWVAKTAKDKADVS